MTNEPVYSHLPLRSVQLLPRGATSASARANAPHPRPAAEPPAARGEVGTMSVTTYDVEQRTDEWYELRRGIVTASTVGKLITTKTLKPANNDTSRGLTAQLAAERITGRIEESGFVSDDMFRGITEEPRARERYAEVNGVEVKEVGFQILRDHGITLGCSPDGLVGDDGQIEVKSPRPKGHLLTILADAVPEWHMAQCQAALLVSGRDWLDFISWSPGEPMFVKRVTPDPRWQEAIIAAVTEFEVACADMVAAYNALTADLPTTERLDLEVVI